MSNLENKLKKIIDTFNKENREIAFKDIKKLSEKYNNNISVQKVLFQIMKLKKKFNLYRRFYCNRA